MSIIEAWFIFGCLSAIAAFWAAPHGMGQNAVAAITACVLIVAAPISAIWLVGSIALTPPLMRFGERSDRRGAVVAGLVSVLAILLVLSRQIETWSGRTIVLVGAAYFTLRHVHVLMEWWLRRIPVPSFGAYARYHLFLPVIVAGPIHRLPHFERQCVRRRWDATEFFSGAERALVGLFIAVAIGNFVFAHVQDIAAKHLETLSPFFREWILSALDWLRLYLQFAGFTDLALGLSLMMGLRLEENFNRPWRARNLIDFWTRWHMTLSLWCRDYVYVPVAARFRSPPIGVVSAMVVLGLWHETSAYYVLWAFWQAFGIVLTRVYTNANDPLRLGRLLPGWQAVLAPVAILAWLSAARPVVLTILGF
jgi:alginate O-acetyltransferase complex protein AlgI